MSISTVLELLVVSIGIIISTVFLSRKRGARDAKKQAQARIDEVVAKGHSIRKDMRSATDEKIVDYLTPPNKR